MREREPRQAAFDAAEAICAACGSAPGGIRVVAAALERMIASVETDAAGLGIEDIKSALRAYVGQGYASGTTSSFVRDVLSVMRDMPDFASVKDDLEAGVRKLVGC